MAASKSTPPTTARRRAGSAGDVKVQWDERYVRVLDPRTGQLLREHLRQQRGGHRIPDEDRPAQTPLAPRCNCWPAASKAGTPHRHALPSACTATRAKSRFAAFRACSRSPASTAPRSPTTPAPPLWKSDVFANPYRFVRRYLERRPQLTACARWIPSSASSLCTATSSTNKTQEDNHA